MTSEARVWIENPGDGGSAVWHCEQCGDGRWCFSYDEASSEAQGHAKGHGLRATDLHRRRGPAPDPERDAKITALRSLGHSTRAIGAQLGLSHLGVSKALRRMQAAA